MDVKKEMFSRGKKKNVFFEDALFIDPGLGGTGWALFARIGTASIDPQAPSESGVMRPKEKTVEKKADEICAWFSALLETKQVQVVVFESPELWGDSAKSQASAQRGDLFKLSYLIGGLGEIVRQKLKLNPILIHPREWKGQLPKEVVIHRIQQSLPEYIGKLRDHEADAIGMGLAAQGRI